MTWRTETRQATRTESAAAMASMRTRPGAMRTRTSPRRHRSREPSVLRSDWRPWWSTKADQRPCVCAQTPPQPPSEGECVKRETRGEEQAETRNRKKAEGKSIQRGDEIIACPALSLFRSFALSPFRSALRIAHFFDPSSQARTQAREIERDRALASLSLSRSLWESIGLSHVCHISLSWPTERSSYA